MYHQNQQQQQYQQQQYQQQPAKQAPPAYNAHPQAQAPRFAPNPAGHFDPMMDIQPPINQPAVQEQAYQSTSLVQASTEELYFLAATALHERCAESRHLEGQHRTRFHSSRMPPISVADYVKRVFKYARCSPECLIIAVIYLDQYVMNTKVPLTFRNVHRLAIVVIMLAAKARDDLYYANSYYARIGGITPQEMFVLELELLHSLEWATHVEPSRYDMYVQHLQHKYNGGANVGPAMQP